MGMLRFQARQRSHPLGKEAQGGEYGKVSTRAWIWQERYVTNLCGRRILSINVLAHGRMLSARTVFFTDSALKFECRAHSVWEGFGEGVTGPSWSAQLENISHRSWLGLVEEYMRRDISRPSDRLPAAESVIRRIERSRGWSPLWGMWENALLDSLGWQVEMWNGPGSKHLCKMNPGFYAPTWSWAGVDGPISYGHILAEAESNDQRVYDLEIQKSNAATGVITVAGHVISGELRCEVTESLLQDPESREESIATGKKIFDYDYNYTMIGIALDGRIYADVALEPWIGAIDGQNISTVIRVPYGEAWPEVSWTSNCLCLMVGRQKLRSLILFLGRSLRIPGAWERIGIVDGLNPGFFENSERRVIDIA
jgi:hypothetical protein